MYPARVTHLMPNINDSSDIYEQKSRYGAPSPCPAPSLLWDCASAGARCILSALEGRDYRVLTKQDLRDLSLLLVVRFLSLGFVPLGLERSCHGLQPNLSKLNKRRNYQNL